MRNKWTKILRKSCQVATSVNYVVQSIGWLDGHVCVCCILFRNDKWISMELAIYVTKCVWHKSGNLADSIGK